MQFTSFGIMRRVSRKTGREMSAQAESCELRTLLCASVVSGGTVDSLEPPVDGSVDSLAGVAETDLNNVAPPIDGGIFEMMPVEPGIHEDLFIFDISDELWMPLPDEAMTFVVYDSTSPDDSDGPVDALSGGPVDWLSDGPPDGPVDWPVDGPPDGPVDWPVDGPTDGPVDWPVDGPTDGPVDWPVDGPTDGPVDWLSGGPLDWPVDGPNGEKLLIAEEVCLDDAPPVDGWDPSWLYRTLTLAEGDGSEEIVVDQGTGWEDGSGYGVAPDGSVLGELAPHDFDIDGVPDEFVMYAFDPLPWEDFQGEPVEVNYFGGVGLASEEGEVAVEVDKPASYPNDYVDYAFDQEPLEDVSGEPVDVVEDGELVPIRTLKSSDFDPAVVFYSAAAGGVEVQRTNDNGGVDEETAVASTVAIPVRPNTSNSLFDAGSGRSSVGIPVGLQTTLALGSNASPAKRNTPQRRLSTQVAAARPSVASEGLDSLTPLLGGEMGPGENDSRESSALPQEVETELVEETVSDSGNASSGASGFAVNQNFSARNARTAMIDRVMALYAENSFNG